MMYFEELVPPFRIANTIAGIIAVFLMLRYVRLCWGKRDFSERLLIMGLFFLVLAGTYGSFEARYMETTVRVPMVSTALIWVIVACILPKKRGRRGKQ